MMIAERNRKIFCRRGRRDYATCPASRERTAEDVSD